MDQILYCCRWHDVDDAGIPHMTPELVCLKDADGLDRVRINDLNPDLLRSEYARSLVSDAWVLDHVIERAGDAWEAALKIAETRGYL
jgi:hypothetical protein